MNPAPHSLPRFARAALVAVFAALPAAGLLAQNSTYNASKGDQQWGTAANWTGSGVPNSAGAIANVSPSGGVSNLAISNFGLGYSLSPPTVTLTGGNGTGGGVASATMAKRVAIIQVDNAGSGYTTAPTVLITGGNGTVSAVGTASINTATGKVTGVSIGFAGYGFTDAPTVTLTGGNGTGATAVASIAPGVVGFNISTVGVYTSVPTVAIAAPSGTFTTANATATLTSGAVSAVTIGNAGAGYVAPPTVTFAAAPTGGTTATGYAVLSGATVGSIAITHAGSGYVTVPTVTLSAPNATAAATASLNPLLYLDNVGGTYPYTVGALNFTAGGEIGRANTAADILKLEQSSGTPTIDVSGANSLFFYGSLDGTQGFNKTGTGTLTFRFNPDANTISGPIGVNGGTLGIQSESSLGNGNNTVTIAGGAKLLAQPSTNAAITIPATRAITLAGANAQIGSAMPYTAPLSIPGNITGAGGLTKTDGGVLLLTGNNTYLGNTTVSGGLLVVATPAALPSYSTSGRIFGTSTGSLVVRMGGVGEWSQSDFNDLINVFPTFAGTSTIGVDTTNATETVSIVGLRSSVVDFSVNHGLAKAGPGTLEVTGDNIYNGPTTIFEGTLKLTGGDNRLPTTTALTFSNNATLDLGSTNQNIRGLTLNSPAKVLGNGTLTLEATTADINLAVTATGTSLDFSGLSNFTFNGNSNLRTLQLNATNANVVNTAFLAKTGINQFDAASVRFGGGGANAAGQNVVVGLGQTNNFNVVTEFVVGNFQGSGNVSFQAGLTNPTLTVRGAGGTGSALRVSIANTNSGNQPSVGVLNTTGGSVDIQATTLFVARHFANASGTTSTGNFTFNAGSITADTLAIAAKSLNDAAGVTTGAPTLTGTVNQNGGNVTATTVILGLNVNTELPNLIANYNLNAGQLRATTITGSGATFGNSTVRNLTLNGGTLRNITGGNLTVTGLGNSTQARANVILGSNGGTFNADSATVGNIILGGNTTLSGNGSLTKTGVGTLSISAPAYAGNTTISEGKVSLSAANAANEASTVSIASGAVLELNFVGNDTVDKLFLNATQQPSGTYTSADVSGAFAGNGSLVVTSGPVVSDTTPPAAPTVSLLAASDTGSSSSDLITNLTTPTIVVVLNGTGPSAPLAGDVVKLFNGATQVASATLVAGDISTGSVNLTSSVLAPGSLPLTATVTDAANNVSTASNTLTVTLDTTAPVIAAAAPVSSDWGSSYSDVTPIATDAIPANPVVITTGSVNIAKPGAYFLSYNAQDTAGNNAVQVQRTVTVTIANPTVVGADGLTPLMRYAFGANGPSDTVQVPTTSATSTTLSITAVVRTDDPKLTVLGTTKTDLASGSWTTTGVSGSPAGSGTGSPLSPGLETKVYTVTTGTRTFLRLEATLAP